MMNYNYYTPLKCEEEFGYYHIPCFSKYIINRSGHVKYLANGNYCICNYYEGDMLYDLLRDDNCTYEQISRSRLLLLTFRYQQDWEDLGILHNNPYDEDSLNNVEWDILPPGQLKGQCRSIDPGTEWLV